MITLLLNKAQRVPTVAKAKRFEKIFWFEEFNLGWFGEFYLGWF